MQGKLHVIRGTKADRLGAVSSMSGRSWQDELLAVLPSGIDLEQLRRFRNLTPTERLEEMRRLLVSLREATALRSTNDPGLPHTR
jgi:hypothetical protein